MTVEPREMAEEAERHPRGHFMASSGPLKIDPFAVIDELGSVPPFWADDSSDVMGYWVVTRYSDARGILQDHERFSAVGAPIPWVQLEDPLLPKLLRPTRGPEIPKGGRPRDVTVRDRAAQAADGRGLRRAHRPVRRSRSLRRGRGIRQRLPDHRVPGVLRHASAERAKFAYWATRWLHDRKNQPEAWARIREIVATQIEAKRGGTSDDLLGVIANATIDGELIPDKAAVSLASTVFIGGLHTVPMAISWSLRHLARHPEIRAALVADLSQSRVGRGRDAALVRHGAAETPGHPRSNLPGGGHARRRPRARVDA